MQSEISSSTQFYFSEGYIYIAYSNNTQIKQTNKKVT